MSINLAGFELDLLTILIALGVLIVVVFLLRFVWSLTAALFRIGCIFFILIAIFGGAYYFLFLR
jgi:hypothetical protein